MKRNSPLRTFKTHEVGEAMLSQPVTIVVGPLGAGKTTLADMYLHSLPKAPENRYLVVTNDLGPGVDDKRIKKWSKGMDVTVLHIDTECACCDAREAFRSKLQGALTNAEQNKAPFTHIMIEPSGAARMHGILAAIPQATDIQIVSVVSPENIIDNPHHTLAHADTIAVTRAAEHEKRKIREAIKGINTNAPIHFLPDPHKKIERGTERPEHDDAWETFLADIGSRKKYEKPIAYSTHASEDQKLEGLGIYFPTMTPDDLQAILRGHCARAKGVTTFILPDRTQVCRSFDFAYGYLRLHERTSESTHSPITVIGTTEQQKAIAKGIEAYKNGQRVENPSVQEVLTQLSGVAESTLVRFETFNESATQHVLDQADKYFSLLAESKAKKIEGDTLRVEELEEQMELLGDSMYYDTPVVWLMYKAKAYGQEQLPNRPAPVRTWGDLLEHASPKGYICTNRLNYLRKAWKQHTDTLHTNGEFDDQWQTEMQLEEIGKDPIFQRFAALVTPAWIQYERSTLGKWKNF